MEKKHYLTLDKEFIQFCKLNDIENIDDLAKKTFSRGFTILKYGETPSEIKTTSNVVVKEVIKEIPIEKIIEKEIFITDNELVTENKLLKEEVIKLKESLLKMNKSTVMKNSKLDSLYGE
jgi:hypothetical protein